MALDTTNAPPPPPAADTSATNGAPAVAQPPMIIFAESSLKKVIQELAQGWADAQQVGPQLGLSLMNSGTLRTKVESGEACDLIISADVQDVKAMNDKGLLIADGQRSLARNSVIIYGRKALLKDDELDWFDLVGTEWKKIAAGSADVTASGRVAQRALQNHHLVNEHQDAYVYTANEVAALGLAQRDDVQAVFVYKTDVLGLTLPGFDLFPLTTEDAPPVFYTAAVCKTSTNAAFARSFIDYCSSEPARAIWAKYGFETN